MTTSKFVARQSAQKLFLSCLMPNIVKEAKLLLWDEGKCRVAVKLRPESLSGEKTLIPGTALDLARVTSALALFGYPDERKMFKHLFRPTDVPSNVNTNISFMSTIPVEEYSLVKAHVVGARDGPSTSINVTILNDKASGNLLFTGTVQLPNTN